MDARIPVSISLPRAKAVWAVFAIAVAAFGMTSLAAAGEVVARVQSRNFEVYGLCPATAARLLTEAEQLRRTLATEWFGTELPTWSERCRIVIDSAPLRMSGATTYRFHCGDVVDWRMTLRGPLDAILESLLPHEVAHTVLASHFRRPIPRWADEGLAVQVESAGERRRLREMMQVSLHTERLWPVASLMQMQEYPADAEQLRKLYLQSSCLTDYLLQAGMGRFVEFLQAGMVRGWEPALREAYGFESFSEVDRCWRAWLDAGRPAVAVLPESSATEIATAYRQVIAQTGEPSLLVTTTGDAGE